MNIPRHQRILFWTMLVGSVLMAVFLLRLREHARDRLLVVDDPRPIAAPTAIPDLPVTYLVANDSDGSIAPVNGRLALPESPEARARVLLEALLDEYAKPGSPHPIAVQPADTSAPDAHATQSRSVAGVFLLPVPVAIDPKHPTYSNAQIAIVNLTAAFAANHPSGIEAETLTLLSIAGTLRANLPQISPVRFLVDGQPRDTLAGHADLTRTYLTASDFPDAQDPR